MQESEAFIGVGEKQPACISDKELKKIMSLALKIADSGDTAELKRVSDGYLLLSVKRSIAGRFAAGKDNSNMTGGTGDSVSPGV